MSQTDDVPSTELVNRWKNGEETAASKLYARYFQRLLIVLNRNLAGRFKSQLDPEDVLQSVFRSVFRRTREGAFAFQDDEELWKLLVTVALNKVRNRVRFYERKKRTGGIELATKLDSRCGHWLCENPSVAEASAFGELFEGILERLDIDDREALRLRLEGFSQHEIATQLNVTERTVRRMWIRIRLVALELLDEGEDERGGSDPGNLL